MESEFEYLSDDEDTRGPMAEGSDDEFDDLCITVDSSVSTHDLTYDLSFDNHQLAPESEYVKITCIMLTKNYQTYTIITASTC